MVIRWWNRVEQWLVAAIAVAALAVFMYGMLARFLLPQLAPDWAGEVTIFLVIWAVMLSASALAGEHRHVRADLIVRVLPRTPRIAAEAFNLLVSLAFCTAMVWSGYLVVDFALLLDERSASTLRIPVVYYYACLPIAMALVTIRYALRLIALVRTKGESELADYGGHLVD
ncbi:MAG: TRAP transporter small permease [Alphaproteobacteria bacterium]|nr:TRAP transporter small permease [Alphaproteobacteria bacterium]